MTEKQHKEIQKDDDLIQAAQHDLRAFDALYLRYTKQVYRYLYSRMGSQPDAEDATAQIYLSALESFDRYRHEGLFAAWLSDLGLTDKFQRYFY